ncbi:MAG: M23 family metallopeptidase [Rhodospirillales bacterium]
MKYPFVSILFVALQAGVFWAWSARAESPLLGMPVDCVVGETCWVVNRVDIDPGPGAVDHNCGDHTYDTHKGIDIAVAGGNAMQRGVDVLAAVPGVVLGIRDGMADVDVSVAGRASVAGRECGNGLLTESEDGWRVQYCHLRRGSVRRGKGDRVATGEVLGQVGMSGLAQFPHLHLQVSRGGTFFDPDTGLEMGLHPCTATGMPMWQPDVAASLVDGGAAIYLWGIAGDVPDAAEARAGRLDDPSFHPDSPALLVWFDMFRPDEGDRLRIRMYMPDGSSFHEQDIVVDKDQSRRFVYTGKRRARGAWPAGIYRAEIELTRAADGKIQQVDIEARIP